MSPRKITFEGAKNILLIYYCRFGFLPFDRIFDCGLWRYRVDIGIYLTQRAWGSQARLKRRTFIAESNANEKNLLFSLICIRFGTWKFLRLKRALAVCLYANILAFTSYPIVSKLYICWIFNPALEFENDRGSVETSFCFIASFYS